MHAVLLSLLTLAAVKPAAAPLQSIDHRGHCRKGVPVGAGNTTVKDRGRTIELAAHGSEYGHHCGEDQGRFAFVELTGDFDVAVQIAAVTNSGAMHFKNHATPAKAGLMAREGNDPGARYVAIWAVSNDANEHYPDAFHFDLRKSPKAWLGSEPKGDFVYGYANKRGQPRPELFQRDYPNVWVRLQRTGNSFHAFVSKDGRRWHPTSTPKHDTDFAAKLVVGVALSAAPEGNFDARATATFKNLRGLPADPEAVRALVVTGGHDHDPEFYGVFADPKIRANVDPHPAGLGRDLRGRADVLVLYDFAIDPDEKTQQRLRDFVESGRGVVVLHHAIGARLAWPWWSEEVVGGRWVWKATPEQPASTYDHDQDMNIRPVGEHAITRGLRPFRILDETYKSLWVSPRVKVLLETDHPTADRAVAWIGPHEKARVVYIQLGHGRDAHLNPSWQKLVRNAIFWAGGRL